MKLTVLIFLCTLIQQASFAKTLTIRVPNFYQNDKYIQELLKMTLEATKSQGSYKIEVTKSDMTQDRVLSLMRQNKDVDILWTMTSQEREEGLAPIRIPILKGLLGTRILIIHRGDQAKFDKIKNLEDFKKLTMGQGQDWPDTFILEAAGLKVQKVANYSSLFDMLNAKRFDAFPRGLNEAYDEVKKRPDMDLEVENKLLIVYPAPEYFFVSTQNSILKNRLQAGLEKLIKDGSFQKLFDKYWSQYQTLAHLQDRKVFKLDNAFLTPQTRQAMKEHPERFTSF